MSEAKSLNQDISTEAEIRQLVDAFYLRVQTDEVLGPIFQEKVENWENHLPIMYAFWESILFGTTGYRGNPFSKHINLPVSTEHFERWLAHFLESVDALFAGPKAEHAKGAARSIAHSFQVRIGMRPGSETGRFF